jgi:serpin B
LDDHISKLSFSEQLRAIIASSLYYKSAWAESFNEGATREDLFHAEDGDEKAMFMNRTDYMPLYQGEGFRALSVGLAGGDSMRLVLPDEGVGIDEVVASDALYDYLTKLPGEEGAKSARVHLSLPRFDADSSRDLIAGLMELGVSEVFTDSADFSPLSDQPLAVDEISHAVRVKTDEDGIEAAAYTVIMVKATAAMPVDLPVDFIVDRPFLFEIVNAEGLPLFTGVVKHAE